MRIPVLILIAAMTLAGEAAGQAVDPRLAPPRLESRAAAPMPNSSGSLVVEALGGSVGSLLGVGAIALTSCHGDDLGCSIIRVGAGGVAGAVGATIGTTLAARYTNSRRSVVGAALGAVVGTGVGLGVHYAFNRNSDRNLGDAVVVPIFVLSQGTFAAIGSRMLGRSPP
jgi:hypothetical protein